MKTPSADLYHLIRSLSRSEKLFFKKNARNKQLTAGRQYLQLFELLSKTREFNEELLIREMGYERKKMAYAVLKNYLYNEVMDTLVLYNQKNALVGRSLQQLQQLAILAEKGLLDQFMKIWRRLYKEALSVEHFQLIFMLKEQLYGLKMNFVVKTNHAQLRKIVEEDNAFTDAYNRLQQLKNLYLHIQLYNKQSQMRLTREDTDEIKSLLNHELLNELPANSHFHYRYYHHMSRALLHYLTHNYQEAYRILEQITNELIRQTAILVNHPFLLVEFINVYYLVAFLCKEYDAFFKFIEHPVTRLFQTESHLAFLFACRANSRLRYLMTMGQYDEAALHLEKVEKEIGDYLFSVPLEFRQLLLGSMGISYFILGRYDDAYYRTKECMKTFHDNPREDIQRYIYPMCIVIAYEMKNNRLILNECDNAYQFFHRRKMMTRFEETLIAFFRKIARPIGRKETRERFALFREELELIRKDPVMGQVFRYFNFYGWAESKEQGISYMEYVKESRRQQQTA
jgi:hypothetical protein